METKQANPQMVATISELVEIRGRQKEDATRAEELTTLIKAYVDNKEGSIKHNTTLLALIKEKARTSIDATLLRTKFPLAAEACKKTSTFLQVECC